MAFKVENAIKLFATLYTIETILFLLTLPLVALESIPSVEGFSTIFTLVLRLNMSAVMMSTQMFSTTKGDVTHIADELGLHDE